MERADSLVTFFVGGVKADTVTANKFIGDLEGNVDWGNIKNIPDKIKELLGVELKDASDEVKIANNFLVTNDSLTNINGKYVGVTSESSETSNKIIYTMGGSISASPNGRDYYTISVNKGYYKLIAPITYQISSTKKGIALYNIDDSNTMCSGIEYIGESYCVGS